MMPDTDALTRQTIKQATIWVVRVVSGALLAILVWLANDIRCQVRANTMHMAAVSVDIARLQVEVEQLRREIDRLESCSPKITRREP